MGRHDRCVELFTKELAARKAGQGYSVAEDDDLMALFLQSLEQGRLIVTQLACQGERRKTTHETVLQPDERRRGTAGQTDRVAAPFKACHGVAQVPLGLEDALGIGCGYLARFINGNLIFFRA